MERESEPDYFKQLLSDAMHHAGRAKDAWDTMRSGDEQWKSLPELGEVLQRAHDLEAQARDLESTVLNAAITLEEQATQHRRGMKRKERATTPDAIEALQALGGLENERRSLESEGPNLYAEPRELDSDSEDERRQQPADPMANIPTTSYNLNFHIEEEKEEEKEPRDGSEESNNDSLDTKKCNCKKSRCLKLYCECFSSGIFCEAACMCRECLNIVQYTTLVTETRQHIIDRSPNAFAPKVSGVGAHKKGCHCKKSRCLKKYCECYQANVPCTDACRCENCMNNGPEGPREDSPQESLFDEGALAMMKRRISQAQSQGRGSEGTTQARGFSQSQSQSQSQHTVNAQRAPFSNTAALQVYHNNHQQQHLPKHASTAEQWPYHSQVAVPPQHSRLDSKAHNYEAQHGSKRFEQPPEATAHENQQYVEARCMPRHGTRFAISRGNTGLEVLTYQGRRHPEVNQQVTSHTSQNSRRHPKLKPLDHTRRHPPRLEKTLSLGMGKKAWPASEATLLRSYSDPHLGSRSHEDYSLGALSSNTDSTIAMVAFGNKSHKMSALRPEDRSRPQASEPSSRFAECLRFKDSGARLSKGPKFHLSAFASLKGRKSFEDPCHQAQEGQLKSSDQAFAQRQHNGSTSTSRRGFFKETLPAHSIEARSLLHQNPNHNEPVEGPQISNILRARSGFQGAPQYPSNMTEPEKLPGSHMQAKNVAKQVSTSQFMRLSPAVTSGSLTRVCIQSMPQPSLSRDSDAGNTKTLILGVPSMQQQYPLHTAGSSELTASHMSLTKFHPTASMSNTHSSQQTTNATRDDATSPPVGAMPEDRPPQFRLADRAHFSRNSNLKDEMAEASEAAEDPASPLLRWGSVRHRKIIPRGNEKNSQPQSKLQSSTITQHEHFPVMQAGFGIQRALNESSGFRPLACNHTSSLPGARNKFHSGCVSKMQEYLNIEQARKFAATSQIPNDEREAVGALLQLECGNRHHY